MIKNAGLSTSWALAVYAINTYGMTIQGEPDRPDTHPQLTKDGCLTIEYGPEAIREILLRYLHPLYPQQHGLESHVNQYRIGSPEYYHANLSEDQFDYTYTKRTRRTECLCDQYNNSQCDGYVGDYRCEYYKKGEYTDGHCYVDQLLYIAEHLEPFNRRLQAITWVVEEDLDTALSIPCLQRVQIRNLGNGYYEIFFDWRSRDLMKAYLWNIIALVSSINVLINETRKAQHLELLTLVKVTDRITAAHIYYPEWELANRVSVTANTIVNSYIYECQIKLEPIKPYTSLLSLYKSKYEVYMQKASLRSSPNA
jgi:thymidylate synthase